MHEGFKPRNHPQQVKAGGGSPEVDDRTLPPGDFAIFQERFGFTIDVAASKENARLPRFYTEAENGLAQSWKGERVYCNPPYSDIEPWIVKAWEETDAELIVLLLPANRTDQGWWQRLVEPFRDRVGSRLRSEFMRGRRRFLKPGQQRVGPNERPLFGSVLLIWERLV